MGGGRHVILEDLGGDEGWETMIRIYWITPLFLKKKIYYFLENSFENWLYHILKNTKSKTIVGNIR